MLLLRSLSNNSCSSWKAFCKYSSSLKLKDSLVSVALIICAVLSVSRLAWSSFLIASRSSPSLRSLKGWISFLTLGDILSFIYSLVLFGILGRSSWIGSTIWTGSSIGSASVISGASNVGGIVSSITVSSVTSISLKGVSTLISTSSLASTTPVSSGEVGCTSVGNSVISISSIVAGIVSSSTVSCVRSISLNGSVTSSLTATSSSTTGLACSISAAISRRRGIGSVAVTSSSVNNSVCTPPASISLALCAAASVHTYWPFTFSTYPLRSKYSIISFLLRGCFISPLNHPLILSLLIDFSPALMGLSNVKKAVLSYCSTSGEPSWRSALTIAISSLAGSWRSSSAFFSVIIRCSSNFCSTCVFFLSLRYVPTTVSIAPVGPSATPSKITSPNLNSSPDANWARASPVAPNPGCKAKASPTNAPLSRNLEGTLEPISVIVSVVGVFVLVMVAAFSAFLRELRKAPLIFPAIPKDNPSITAIGIPRLRANSLNSAIFISFFRSSATALSSDKLFWSLPRNSLIAPRVDAPYSTAKLPKPATAATANDPAPATPTPIEAARAGANCPKDSNATTPIAFKPTGVEAISQKSPTPFHEASTSDIATKASKVGLSVWILEI